MGFENCRVDAGGGRSVRGVRGSVLLSFGGRLSRKGQFPAESSRVGTCEGKDTTLERGGPDEGRVIPDAS